LLRGACHRAAPCADAVARNDGGSVRFSVMPGLVPGIHVLLHTRGKDVDGRVKPGHNDVGLVVPMCCQGDACLRQNNPTGKFPLNPSGKSPLQLRPSHPMRGAGRDRHETRGGMRWTRRRRMTNAVVAYGEYVWS
jgi:hypothetical protein